MNNEMIIIWRGSFPSERYHHTELSLMFPPLPDPRRVTLTNGGHARSGARLFVCPRNRGAARNQHANHGHIAAHCVLIPNKDCPIGPGRFIKTIFSGNQMDRALDPLTKDQAFFATSD